MCVFAEGRIKLQCSPTSNKSRAESFWQNCALTYIKLEILARTFTRAKARCRLRLRASQRLSPCVRVCVFSCVYGIFSFPPGLHLRTRFNFLTHLHTLRCAFHSHPFSVGAAIFIFLSFCEISRCASRHRGSNDGAFLRSTLKNVGKKLINKASVGLSNTT